MKRFLLFLLLIGGLFVFSCNSAGIRNNEDMVSLEGQTMGTELQVQYIDSLQRDFSKELDSILIEVNNSMSTYIPNSLISIFNKMDSAGTLEVDRHFYKVLLIAKEIHRESHGAFNPALYPIIHYWGFSGGTAPDYIDSSKVDSLLKICNFDLISGTMAVSGDGDTSYYVSKQDGRAQLDFGAIAKGYGVDAVHDLLKSKGIHSQMVDIGGEVRCSGLYMNGKAWHIGIEDPIKSKIQSRKVTKVIALFNKAIATSGNYRNFRMIDGKRMVHTINPANGYPELNSLLSVSIIADDCTHADAYATSCMVLGLDDARELITNNTAIDGLLIYGIEEGQLEYWSSPGFQEIVVKD